MNDDGYNSCDDVLFLQSVRLFLPVHACVRPSSLLIVVYVADLLLLV